MFDLIILALEVIYSPHVARLELPIELGHEIKISGSVIRSDSTKVLALEKGSTQFLAAVPNRRLEFLESRSANPQLRGELRSQICYQGRTMSLSWPMKCKESEQKICVQIKYPGPNNRPCQSGRPGIKADQVILEGRVESIKKELGLLTLRRMD